MLRLGCHGWLLAQNLKQKHRSEAAGDSVWLGCLLLTWACGSLTHVMTALYADREVRQKDLREAEYANEVRKRDVWMLDR